MREKARSAIYGMAGFYILYLAYKMYMARDGGNGSDSNILLLFAILFVAAGIGLFGLAVYMMRIGKRTGTTGRQGEAEPEDEAEK